MSTADLVERVRRSAPGTVATDAAKAVLRVGATATAGWRPPPDYLIIGAKRGGTTSLHAYLGEHPGVMPLFPRPQKIKGAYFFDEGFTRGRRWYLSHFPTRVARGRLARQLGYEPVAGDATPYYLYHPLAPTRAADVVPAARIVAVLRDPVERAFSHYKERRSNGTEPLTFEAALAAEEGRLAGEEMRIVAEPGYISFAHRHQSYVDQGRYATPLRRWIDAFGQEQVLILLAEDLYRDPQGTYDQITDHIGLPRHTLRDPVVHNAEPSAALDPATADRLRAELAPDIADVEALIGRPTGWL